MKIVFVLLDALRYDVFREKMPNLEEHARESMDYTKCLSSGPNTVISINRLLGHIHPWEEETRKNNLIEDLKKKDYFTQIVFSSPRLYRYQDLFDKKVDVFIEDTNPLLGQIREKYHNSLPFKAFRKYVVGLGYQSAENLTNYAIPFVNEAPSNSFTWIHYMDPHIPWIPPGLERIELREAQYLEKKMRKTNWTTEGFTQDELHKCRELYERECIYLDSEVARLLSSISADIVIITADHGDLLGEYDRFSHPHLYVPELLHVPMIINGESKGKIERWASHYELRGIINKMID